MVGRVWRYSKFKQYRYFFWYQIFLIQIPLSGTKYLAGPWAQQRHERWRNVHVLLQFQYYGNGEGNVANHHRPRFFLFCWSSVSCTQWAIGGLRKLGVALHPGLLSQALHYHYQCITLPHYIAIPPLTSITLQCITLHFLTPDLLSNITITLHCITQHKKT